MDNFDAGMQLVGYGNDPTTAGNFVLMPREYVNGVLVDKHPALVEPNDYSIVRKGDGFEIIFNKAIDYPIDIRYKTEVTDIVDENTVYGNTVTDGTHTDNGDGSADQQNVVKTHTVDPATNTITWLIYINLNRYEMNNFRLKDVISVGQKFGNPDDLIITDIDDTNKVLTYGQDYTAIMSTPTMSITFRPPYDNTNHAFTIQYTTRYDGTQADVFANTATSHWTGSDGKDHGSTDTDSYTPTSEEQENGAKEGTYNATTKEITWVIRINYNDIELINARVTDTLAANQTYVADSLKVYTYTQQAGTGKPLRGSELTAAQYAALTTWTEPTAANGKTLVIGLPDAAGGASAYYWIEYKTSLEGEIIGTEAFTNTAQWHNGATGDFDLNASVSVANGGSYVGKQGMVGADGYMHWTVTVNQSQSTLSDVVITDTPDSNQLVDVDSIVVYPTTVAANGNVSIDQSASPLVLGQDYMVSYKADNSGVYTLVIKFIGAYETISRPYIIDFKVTVIAGSAPSMELTNDAVITGTGKEEIYQPGSGSSTVTVGNGGGWLRGPSGAAILHKVDSVTGQPIPGVTFQLYFDNSGVQGGPYGPPRTTNSNGDIIFLDLQYGDYWLEEITQLPGYSYMNPNPQKITLSSSGATVTYRIENDPSYLVLTKVDSENHGALEGVKYDLYRKNGSYTLYQSGLVTNAGGQLVLSALPKGEYYLVETDHLPGYWAEPDPIYFAIERDNTSGELTSTFLNGDGGIPTGNTYTHENRPTRITVRKWDEHGAAGGNALSGASFILEQLVGGNWGQLNPGTFYTSQQNGEIEVTYLPAGTYRFIEVSAPVGYARHTVPLQFTIAEDGTVDIIRDFENWPVIVILHKVDASTGESLSGAIFWLYEYDELAQEWARIRTDETFYTDDNGILTISKLNLNTHYRLVEVTAPAGYSLNGEAIEFDLKPGSITDIEVFDVGDWPNIPSEAALVKTDEESGGALEGAVFKLERYDENAGIWSTYKEGLTTNVNGGISIDGMPAGRYRFIETEAPIGYLLDATPHEFTLATDTNGRIVPARVDVTNRKIEMQPTGAVQTGDNTNLVLWAILGGLSLLGLGVVLVFVWRLRRKQ